MKKSLSENRGLQNSRAGGFTLAELLIFLCGLLIPVFFLIYYSPGIAAHVQEYECRKKLTKISLGLHIYAAQDSGQSFPKGASADEAFRKIFVNGNITDRDVFNDPRLLNGKPSGSPGTSLLSPSTDLAGTDFLYTHEPLGLNSPPDKVIVKTDPAGSASLPRYLALHVDGSITEEKL